MTFVDSLETEIDTILDTKWNERSGNVVPESSDIKLTNGAVEIEATFLYADLAGSSVLAKLCPWETTAKVIRAYLDCCTRLIRIYGGEIRSFDGDRVMGIFKGDSSNTQATNCAREIDWVVEKILNVKAKEKFKSIRENNLHIKHCVGIDFGKVRAVRAGIRNNNDLIWIGKAPSFAAKLSDVRHYPFSVYISVECFGKLSESSKLSGTTSIWEPALLKFAGEDKWVYRTKFMRTP